MPPKARLIVRVYASSHIYQTGDIVVFVRGNSFTVHRVLLRMGSGSQVHYLIKGDNSMYSDGLVESGRIIGKIEVIIDRHRRILLTSLKHSILAILFVLFSLVKLIPSVAGIVWYARFIPGMKYLKRYMLT